MPWNPTTWVQSTGTSDGRREWSPSSCPVVTTWCSQLPKCSNPQVNKCSKVALKIIYDFYFWCTLCVGGGVGGWYENASSCMPLCAWREVRWQPMVTGSLLPPCVCQGQSSGCQQCLYLLSKTSHWALFCFLRKLVTVLKQLLMSALKF